MKYQAIKNIYINITIFNRKIKLLGDNRYIIKYNNGNKYWYLNNQRHKEDGPAIEYANGEEWYLNGKLHREDGPAIEYANGNKEWWVKGKHLTEEEFNRQTKWTTKL